MKIIRSFRELDFEKLSAVYGLDAEDKFKEYRELYDYLREDFFGVAGAFYAVVESEDGYISALRSEPYRDGYLIEALQTKPQFRNQGYAVRLLCELVQGDALPVGLPVYAHVHKKNKASLAVHRACGFEQLLDYAVFIDGSVYQNTPTLVLRR